MEHGTKERRMKRWRERVVKERWDVVAEVV